MFFSINFLPLLLFLIFFLFSFLKRVKVNCYLANFNFKRRHYNLRVYNKLDSRSFAIMSPFVRKGTWKKKRKIKQIILIHAESTKREKFKKSLIRYFLRNHYLFNSVSDLVPDPHKFADPGQKKSPINPMEMCNANNFITSVHSFRLQKSGLGSQDKPWKLKKNLLESFLHQGKKATYVFFVNHPFQVIWSRKNFFFKIFLKLFRIIWNSKKS